MIKSIKWGMIVKRRPGFFSVSAVALCVLLAVSLMGLYRKNSQLSAAMASTGVDYIKWVDFTIPYQALDAALKIDIGSYGGDSHVDWVELLAVLGTKYGGSWGYYKAAEMDETAKRLALGEQPEDILKGYKNYDYFYNAYQAVLGGLVGEHQREVPSSTPGGIAVEFRYGLKGYFPVAEGYGYSRYRDFGNSRSYGYRRRHLGHDICGSLGTPIIAVEGGVVEELGWNQYGGWRLGIRSFDGRRYYYYAHMRKDHPYVAGLEEGSLVQGGEVIGYMGMTGYSTTENVNGMNICHLHFGLQLIFDESQKDGTNQIWVDVYDLLTLLERNRATVVRTEDKADYQRKYNLYDSHFPMGD